MIGQERVQPDKNHNGVPPRAPMQGKAKSDSPKAADNERPVSRAYKELDNDLARDNMENDLPDADLQDL